MPCVESACKVRIKDPRSDAALAPTSPLHIKHELQIRNPGKAESICTKRTKALDNPPNAT
eukprot:6332870-Amphidinium_carterae.1